MPTRYLKPGVRDSEAIDVLSPLAETLFYRLLVTVDDFGRYDGRPAMVKAHCFPIKEMSSTQCAELLNELHQAGLVVLYSVDDKPYLQMCKWENIPRSKESKFPPLDAGYAQLHTLACSSRTVLPVTETVTGTETDNRKPETGTGNIAPRSRSATTSKVAKPDDVDEQVWVDWTALRKAKRAVVSETVLDGARSEAAKAGMTLEAFLRVWCLRGSQGLQADWIKPAEKARFADAGFDAERRNREAMELLGFGNVIDGGRDA